MSEKSGSGGLLRSSAVVSLMTLLSRVLGMVRDVVVAAYFGSGAAADAFFVAFKIPNFLRRLFAEGAFAQAFVPVLSEYREKYSPAQVKQLIDRTAGMLGLVLTALTALCVVASPYLIMLFAPGFRGEPSKLQLAGELLASQICGEPLPVERDLAEACDPARFGWRAARQLAREKVKS